MAHDTSKPTIVITGNPAWREKISDALSETYIIHQQAEFDGYMNTLIDSLAALIVVDGTDANWHLWTTTPKVSPATRRIPLVLISADADIRSDAPIKGADFTLTPDEWLANFQKYVADYARIPDPKRMEQLHCECQEPLPELAQEGVRQFNAGEYYAQHDAFEAQWVDTETPVRDLYRAVLQVGVAYFQIERANYRGALKMLQRSVQWLVILPDTCQGIDVKQLREDSFRVRAELERLGEEGIKNFDKSLLKGVTYTPQDASDS
ncbi:MAG: DUF309 domain-containing protein [Chloroflexota bacterium]